MQNQFLPSREFFQLRSSLSHTILFLFLLSLKLIPIIWIPLLLTFLLLRELIFDLHYLLCFLIFIIYSVRIVVNIVKLPLGRMQISLKFCQKVQNGSWPRSKEVFCSLEIYVKSWMWERLSPSSSSCQ